jgi:ATP-dependent DNA helicase RecQ
MNNSIIDQLFETHFSQIGEEVRHEQRLVIESLLDGHNTLSIMPTGGGKSLCYWIAGLALQGTTLVIFPLTALMDEQARKLEGHGLKVVKLHSGVSASSQHKQLLELRNGKMPDFIFASPERIGTDGFFEFILREKRDQIKLVVIDEIHCISQWGHDFRPFYQEIPPFLNAVFDSPDQWPHLLGLTATLNQKDTQQVCQDFHISLRHVFKSQYLLRYPINLSVEKVADEPAKDLLFWAKLAEHRDEKVLVYIENRDSGDRSTEGFCDRASREGYRAAYFHGAMTSEAKAEIIEKFKSGEVLTVFATSAFGMGIDIPDIRGIIHYRPPESIEQFYQQIGRAGRDGLPAWAFVYYSDKNINFRKTYFIDRSFPDEAAIRDTFASITSGLEPIQSFDYFAEESSQTAFHYLLRSGVVRVRCKSTSKIDVFERKAQAALPKFDEYRNATRTGITILVAKRNNESIEQVTGNIYRWWADGKIQANRSVQKCLVVEKLATDLREEKLAAIQADIAEKKEYRYQLLDQLVTLLNGYTNSITLHQEIGRYLGVDKFQMDRIHQTVSGVMVRSKSEVIIANLLSQYGIPFEYERYLIASGVGFLPDFTLFVDGKELYLEHLGRLDLEQYRQNWAIKKAWYEMNFPGQLLTTEEGSTLSQSTELLIKQHLLKNNIQQPESERITTQTADAKATKTVKIWTEGRTDWKHLKAAFKRLKATGQFASLEIQFQEGDDEMGDKELLNSCRAYSRDTHATPIIFIFDRDVPDTLSKIKDTERDYKDWGNRVYSVALPVPTHRQTTSDISIEFYYQDQDIKQIDRDGRRLFIGTEFNKRTGIHESEQINCMDKNKIGKFTIVDQQVFRQDRNSEENIAMSKNQFASNILECCADFENFDLSGFVPLFELINELASRDNP